MLDFFKAWLDGFSDLISGNAPILNLFTSAIEFLFSFLKFVPNTLFLIYNLLPNFAKILYGALLGWLLFILVCKLFKFFLTLGGS